MSHATYLTFELAWALPVLALQWIVGRGRLLRHWRILLVAIALPSAYLSLTDGVAIAQHIWTLHADRILGVRVGDVPVEEIIFFVVTNAMVAQSIVLVESYVRRR
jgi:lycopene cyclase domain-containing protein